MLVNPEDMRRAGLVEGQRVTLECAIDGDASGATRSVPNMQMVPYDLPDGCIGAYYPETNALVPLDYHDIESKTPAYKGTPVRIVP